jgi:signal transduction histidine kinase
MTSPAIDDGQDSWRDDAGDLPRKLVQQLAAAAGTQYALFGTIDDERQAVDAIAVWAGDRFMDDLSYELEGTPCADVVDQGLCVYRQDVSRLFPEDRILTDLGIESYAGIPVRDRSGVPRAIVAVFDPVEIDAARVTPTLEVFAERARAELARRAAEAALEESERGKAAALSFLSRRDAILSGIAGASERLLQAERWEDAIDDVLAVLGRATGSSRAYVFETSDADDGGLVSSMRREWVAEGIEPTIGAPRWHGYHEQSWHAQRLRAGVPSVFRTADDVPEARRAYVAEGTLAYVSVPIRARGRLWGYLGFDDCVKERPWSPLELEALRAAAGTIGAAMERELSDARLDARERILEAVTVAAEILLRAPSWRDAIDDVLRLLGSAGSASRCWLFECFEVDGVVHSRLAHDWCAPGVSESVTEFWRDRVEPSHAIAAFTRGETLQYLREELQPAAQARLEAEGTQSIICVPLLLDGQLTGYIGYDDCVSPRRWSPAEEEALRAAASVLGSAMQTARGLEAVRRRERMLGAVAAAAQRTAAAITAGEAVEAVLDELGPISEASRVFVSRFARSDDGILSVAENFQWAAAGFTVTDPSVWKGMTVPPERAVMYDRGESLQGLAKSFDGPFRDALDADEVVSFLVVPIRAAGVWGVIGFNDCVEERIWDVAANEALRAAAGTLGAVIERELSMDALRASDERLWQARKMEAIGQLAAGLAHDLRNYLTVIVSYASFLRERVAEDGRADADALLETAGRVGDLVDRLLAFGRPQDTVTPELLDVGEVVRGVRDVIRSFLPDSHSLSVSVTPDLDLVLLDRGQLERVIVNLALNARDAMPDPGTLAIVARPDPIGVALDVADTGVGMDKATRDRVFEPFFTTKAGQGTGLGLAIVYGIVTRNDGNVSIASTPDAGTCVTVRLPRATAVG